MIVEATSTSTTRPRAAPRTRSRSPGRAVSPFSGSTHEEVYDAFRDAFVPRVEALKLGDPADEDTDVGPLISESERDRVLAWVEEARAAGATILTGGDLDGSRQADRGRAAACRFASRLRRGVRACSYRSSRTPRWTRRSGWRTRRATACRPGYSRPTRKKRACRDARPQLGGITVNEVLTFRADHVLRRREGLRQHARGPRHVREMTGGTSGRRTARRPARPLRNRAGLYPHRRPLFNRKPAAPAASDLRRERRALLLLREERLYTGGLTLEMYRRDHFNEALVVERCAELVAIEARVSERSTRSSAVPGFAAGSARSAPAALPLLIGARFCPSCGRAIDADEGIGEDTAA